MMKWRRLNHFLSAPALRLLIMSHITLMMFREALEYLFPLNLRPYWLVCNYPTFQISIFWGTPLQQIYIHLSLPNLHYTILLNQSLLTIPGAFSPLIARFDVLVRRAPLPKTETARPIIMLRFILIINFWLF